MNPGYSNGSYQSMFSNVDHLRVPPTYLYRQNNLHTEAALETSKYLHTTVEEVTSINQTSRTHYAQAFENVNPISRIDISNLRIENIHAGNQYKTKYDTIVSPRSIVPDKQANSLATHPLLSKRTRINLNNKKSRIQGPESNKSCISKDISCALQTKMDQNHEQNSVEDSLAWKKCTLNDNRCLGFNFAGDKACEVEYFFRGHVKKNYLE